MMNDLSEKKCIPCEGGVQPLALDKAKTLLAKLKDWQLNEDKPAIYKQYSFKNFYKTMSFVNAVAWIANQENHHPDLQVGYNYCNIELSTHAIAGLSENDFIIAAKIDHLES